MKLVEKFNKKFPNILDAKEKRIIALIICVLGVIIGICLLPSLIQKHMTQNVIITLSWSSALLITILVTLLTKKTTMFNIVTHIIIFVLFIYNSINGGYQGFALSWFSLFLIFALYYYDTLDFTVTFAIMDIMMLIWYYSPLFDIICKNTSIQDGMRYRFPLLFTMEFIFCLIVKIRIAKIEKAKQENFDQLKELKELIATQNEETEKKD